MKEYNPQKAKRTCGQRFSKIHTKELNKHYVKYFSLTPEAKRSLAESLGMTPGSLRKWMQRKRREERDLEEAKSQLQTPYKQEHRLNGAGI